MVGCGILFGPFLEAADGVLVTFRTRTAAFAIDDRGVLVSIRDAEGRTNYIASGGPSPLLSLRTEARLQAPSRATWDSEHRRIVFEYGAASRTAVVAVRTRETHVAFEVVEVRSSSPTEFVVWGPFRTTIGETIGETVGVVRNRHFAVGIQALNARTLGGFPANDSDVEVGGSGDDRGEYPDLPDELRKQQDQRGDTARPTDYGSVLQAFCRNRDHDRIIPNWGHERYLAPAFPDGGVVGSSIALFAGPAAEALETLGAIEVTENLPHPMLDGVWAKASREANASYLIVDFGEDTIDRAIEMTRRAGLRYLYHSSPFETWGHFRLKPGLFPHGWAGLRSCVDKAGAAGIRVGLHTLSNFITPNDPYVSPIPDPRLARIGNDMLAEAVTADQKEIPVASAEYFVKATALNTVVIGNELIRYASVSTNAPWRLRDCQRGAWGTVAAAHDARTTVGRLMDHGYNVFLTDASLSQEVARTIARLCNETGIRQLSFDGLEGNWSTGMGQYGRTLFTMAWYDALRPDYRGQVINDASNPGHFNWHVYTRMNWGEPWYAGFRESQTLYRFKNQLYFERNLMPRMLGWFALRSDTTVEDAEWLLARAAGFGAGFALAGSLASTAQLEADPASADAVRRFGSLPAILDAVAQWETARLAGAFPGEVRAELRDNTREFHLEKVREGEWNLFPVHVQRFEAGTNAVGRGNIEFHFVNPYATQLVRWVVRNPRREPGSRMSLAIDGKEVLRLREGVVPAGGCVRYAGGRDAAVCDGAGRELTRVPVGAEETQVERGPHRLGVDIGDQPVPAWKLELQTRGSARSIRVPASGAR